MSNDELEALVGTEMTRRQAIKRGAVAGGTVLWVTPVVQNLLISPAGAQSPSPTVTCPGRMNGGGQFHDSNGLTASHGFELRCGEPGVVTNPDRLQVNGEVNGDTFAFHLKVTSVVECSDNPAYSPGNPQVVIDTLHVVGTGTVTGPGGELSGTYTIDATFTDQGEPGTEDRLAIRITAPDDTVFFQSAGYPALTTLLTGNQQSVPNKHTASCV